MLRDFPELGDRAVHVWPLHLEGFEDLPEWFHGILEPDEAERAARFRFDHLRHKFTLHRVALRILLGRYLGIGPAQVKFVYGSKGKPRLAGPSELSFNTSHSSLLALFAFTRGCEIGADVEHVRPMRDLENIAARFFCPEETAELMSIPAPDRELAFFLCWTRKEAYIKAIGEGLSAPLDAFRVSLKPGDPARFFHIGQDRDEAEAWTLHSVTPHPQYAAAIAYRDSIRDVTLMPAVHLADMVRMAHPSRP